MLNYSAARQALLNPCPFCGAGAHVDEHADHWSVVCGGCQACVGYVETEECAIAKWNGRASTDQKTESGTILADLISIEEAVLQTLDGTWDCDGYSRQHARMLALRKIAKAQGEA